MDLARPPANEREDKKAVEACTEIVRGWCAV